MQRNFEPVRKEVEAWRQTELIDVSAKMIIYEAFFESDLEVLKHLARRVHDNYFDPSTMNSGLEQCGAFPTPSPRRFRN
jgi:hypothetical protein